MSHDIWWEQDVEDSKLFCMQIYEIVHQVNNSIITYGTCLKLSKKKRLRGFLKPKSSFKVIIALSDFNLTWQPYIWTYLRLEKMTARLSEAVV